MDGDIPTIDPLHECCNRCHSNCSCAVQGCLVPPYEFDGLANVPSPASDTRNRAVCDEDKECLREELGEVQQSLGFNSGITLFDPTGIITHGLSDSVIDSLVMNCGTVFKVSDLFHL